MSKDPAIDEICAVRHRISEECGHDTRLLVERCREVEKQYADRILAPATLVHRDERKQAAND